MTLLCASYFAFGMEQPEQPGLLEKYRIWYQETKASFEQERIIDVDKQEALCLQKIQYELEFAQKPYLAQHGFMFADQIPYKKWPEYRAAGFVHKAIESDYVLALDRYKKEHDRVKYIQYAIVVAGFYCMPVAIPVSLLLYMAYPETEDARPKQFPRLKVWKEIISKKQNTQFMRLPNKLRNELKKYYFNTGVQDASHTEIRKLYELSFSPFEIWQQIDEDRQETLIGKLPQELREMLEQEYVSAVANHNRFPR